MKKINKQRVIDYSKFELSLEMTRENQLQSRVLILTLINISLVFISTLMCYYIPAILSLINLILLIQTQWFYKKHYLRHPMEFYNHVDSFKNYSNDSWLDQQISDYDSVEKNYCKQNNKRTKWCIISELLADIIILIVIVELIVSLF